MADPRFFTTPEPLRLDAVAEMTGAVLVPGADPGQMVTGAAPLSVAGPSELSFLGSARHLESLLGSAAGACILTEALAGRAPEGIALLVHPAPQQAYTEVLCQLYPEPEVDPGIDPGVHIDPAATIGPGCAIEAGAVIGAGADIGPGSRIGPGTVIGANTVIGPEARIGGNVTITHTLAGARFRVLAGAAIGQDGFGFVPGKAGLRRIPQLGRVVIGDDVEIGANSTVDRGAGEDTVIGDGTKIDNLVQIAHNCRIGRHCVIVSHVGLSGSVTVGDGAQLGGQAGVADHVRIGQGAQLAARAGVMRDVPDGAVHAGAPAQPIRDWHRETALLKRLLKQRRTRD